MKTETTPHDLLVALLLVQNVIERKSEVFFLSHGLTAAQFNILNLLSFSEGPMDQLALTERLLVGKSSISIVLNRMVKAGLIARQEHPRDRRQVVLAVTRKGRSLWQKISPQYEESVTEIFGTLPKERRGPFLKDLDTLYGALKQIDGKPGDTPFPSLRETLQQMASAANS